MELQLTLLSDAAFATGEGVAGLLDSELQHDALGLPYLRGRSLKGLLAEECANLRHSIQQHGNTSAQDWLERTAVQVFGNPGQGAAGQGGLAMDDARVPDDLRAAVRFEVTAGRWSPAAVLESLSAIRRQTAINAQGAPLHGSLRATRVLLRETCLEARLALAGPPEHATDAWALVAACAMTLRRAGSSRNRGLGRVRARLWQDGADATDLHWQAFRTRLEEIAP
ncbi:MAG: hypothetical protein IPN92_19535 [Chromatiaceae bacterium]|nr:hypothetical protein [Chromatiaceae bacterium]